MTREESPKRGKNVNISKENNQSARIKSPLSPVRMNRESPEKKRGNSTDIDEPIRVTRPVGTKNIEATKRPTHSESYDW